MTHEEEIAGIYDVVKTLTAEINALTDVMQPYFAHKQILENELREIEFTIRDKRSAVQSVKFCGVSSNSCKQRLEKHGEILEPGHFVTIEREVLTQNREGIADRRVLFAELLDLSEEWGPRNNKLRGLMADRLALGRRLEALKAILARRKQNRVPRLWDD